VRAALACLAVGSLAACIGKGGGGGGPAKPKAPVGPAIDAKEAQQGASELVIEIYETLGRGNTDSLFTLLNDSLMVFGPRSSDMLGTRADALVAIGQVVNPKAKKQLAIQSDYLEVVPAPGGHSAVAVDVASINGQPHVVMAVLTNFKDLWLVDAVAVAHTPAAAQLKAELAKDAVVPPGAAGAKKIDPAARPVVEKFQKGLLDQMAWGEELASHDDPIVVGPMAGEVTHGKQEVQAMWKKRVEAKTRAAVSGEITAAVTNDGQLAWVSAPITRVEGEGTQPLPLRAFAVYENQRGEWKLLALDESLAFGAPGAGVSFKKILPPKPVEPKPVEVIAAKPKDKAEPAKDKPEAKKAKVKQAKAEEPAQETPKKKAKPAKAEELAVEEAPKKTAKKPAKAEEPAEEAPKKKSKLAKTEEPAAEEAPKKPAKKPAKAEEPAEEAPKKKSKLAKTEEPAAEEAPKKKRKRTFARLSDDSAEEEAPEKPAKKPAKAEEEEAPKKTAKKPAKAEEEEAPKKKAKAGLDAIDEEPAKKPAKKPGKAAAEEEAPKKKAKGKTEEPAEEAPKKKAKPKAEEDDDVVEVTD